MSPHDTLKGERSRQRRPGAKNLHPARGCAVRMLPAPAGRVPHSSSRGQEQLWRRNVPRHPHEPRGGGHGDQHGQPEGHGAGAAGPAGPASPVGSRRRRAVPAAGSGGREGKGCGGSPGRPPALTVDVLPVADVLQVAARVLPAQLGLGAVGLQPRVGIPAQLGAGGDAAGRGVPHLLCPAPARPGSGGGEGRPVSEGGGKPWAAAATRGSGGGGGGGGCGALRLHSPAVPPGGSSAEAAPQRGPSAWAAAAKPPSSAGGQRGARRGTAPSSPAPAQPPAPLRARTHAAASQPPRQRHRSSSSSRPGRPPRTGSGSSGR